MDFEAWFRELIERILHRALDNYAEALAPLARALQAFIDRLEADEFPSDWRERYVAFVAEQEGQYLLEASSVQEVEAAIERWVATARRRVVRNMAPSAHGPATSADLDRPAGAPLVPGATQDESVRKERSVSDADIAGSGGQPPDSAQRPADTPDERSHGNSLDYVGETHVYAIRGPEGIYKIGQSMQGVRVGDGMSIRAESQVRRLRRATGTLYQSEIVASFPDKRMAVAYEETLIERIRAMFGPNALPGNKTNR